MKKALWYGLSFFVCIVVYVWTENKVSQHVTWLLMATVLIFFSGLMIKESRSDASIIAFAATFFVSLAASTALVEGVPVLTSITIIIITIVDVCVLAISDERIIHRFVTANNIFYTVRYVMKVKDYKVCAKIFYGGIVLVLMINYIV